jgi:hypothetical protein
MFRRKTCSTIFKESLHAIADKPVFVTKNIHCINPYNEAERALPTFCDWQIASRAGCTSAINAAADEPRVPRGKAPGGSYHCAATRGCCFTPGRRRCPSPDSVWGYHDLAGSHVAASRCRVSPPPCLARGPLLLSLLFCGQQQRRIVIPSSIRRQHHQPVRLRPQVNLLACLLRGLQLTAIAATGAAAAMATATQTVPETFRWNCQVPP